MSREFAQLAFTPLVRQQQIQHGSRQQYERVEQHSAPGNRLGPHEREFILHSDGFYMGTVSETGWPYVQYRGGAPGFLHVLDDRTLGFADLRGNRQYISTGNLEHDSRIALFLMHYPSQSRLKILGRADVHERDARAADLLSELHDPHETSPAERAIVIHVEAFDWNCQQHITPRFTRAEIADALAPLQQQIASLKEENARLRQAQSPQAPSSAR